MRTYIPETEEPTDKEFDIAVEIGHDMFGAFERAANKHDTLPDDIIDIALTAFFMGLYESERFEGVSHDEVKERIKHTLDMVTSNMRTYLERKQTDAKTSTN